MIKLPRFTLQSMYDSETEFNLQMSEERLAKLLIHYEAFKLVKNLKGSIVKGRVIIFDNYLRNIGKKTRKIFYQGKTNAINKFLAKRKKKVIFSELFIRPSYIIK